MFRDYGQNKVPYLCREIKVFTKDLTSKQCKIRIFSFFPYFRLAIFSMKRPPANLRVRKRLVMVNNEPIGSTQREADIQRESGRHSCLVVKAKIAKNLFILFLVRICLYKADERF